MMETIRARKSDYRGCWVALEGSPDVLSTQLRLIPSSPRIAILPPLEYFLKQENDNGSAFDAKTYILRIHEACEARADMAHSFLQQSSFNNKRLLVMNGGTASAQLSCLTAIAQHDTGGDMAKAAAIFNELVRNGVAGLKECSNEQLSTGSSISSRDPSDDDKYHRDDPISRAMRAADALDRQTASLQPNDDVDLTLAFRNRSMSVPLRRSNYDFEEATSFYVSGTSKGNGQERSVERKTDRDLDFGDLRQSSTMHNSGKTVTFAKASIVDIRAPTPKNDAHKRIMSVGRIYASALRSQDISLCRFSQSTDSIPEDDCYSVESTPTHTDSPGTHSIGYKYFSQIPAPTFMKSNRAIISLEPPTYIESYLGTVLRESPSPVDFSTTEPTSPPILYVDTGTNPGKDYVNKGTWTDTSYFDDREDTEDIESHEEFHLGAETTFATVLPMYEDLVINLYGETRDAVLDSVIQGFKDGTYPASMPPLLRDSVGHSEIFGTPISRNSTPSLAQSQTQDMQLPDALASPAYQSDDYEYDTCSTHSDFLRPGNSWLLKADLSDNSAVIAPPTPAQTPPPISTLSDVNFHELPTTNCTTVICVQNNLRSILNMYFSPEDARYHQFNFPLLPELSSLWNPPQDTESGSRKEKRKIDLILAIGSQKGVDKEFLSNVTASLQKLGAKPNGSTRSGRLDLRYLTANAMQAFTAQPLAIQSQSNPFTDPLLLAAIIISHLETYMAAHSDIRFLLLEYPPEHLPTVLALQKLIGVDLLRVVGVVSSDYQEKKFSPRFPLGASGRGAHSNNSSTSGMSTMSSTTSTSLFPPLEAKPSEVSSFTKDNFLIKASAAESEVATLIRNIWKILVDVSHFYIPEGAPLRYTPHRKSKHYKDKSLGGTPLVSSTPEYAPFVRAAVMMGFRTPPRSACETTLTEGKPLASHPLPREPEAVHPGLKQYRSEPSMSVLVKAHKSKRSVANQKNKLQKILGEEAASDVDRAALRSKADKLYLDDSDAEDSTFYAEERKYMPLYGKKPEVDHGSVWKTLKWLGLV